RRKALLQANIALCRLECRAAAVQLTRPLALVDRGLALWRRVSPAAKLFAVPAGLLLSRFFGRARPGGGRGGKLATAMSLLPLILRGAKLVLAARAAMAATKNSPPSPGRT
ncbi:MAG: hypothetical protein JNL92_22135, partial [Opitutaceae bacterium]|nr:hypothetical protein [Opitutaceae bacterium]